MSSARLQSLLGLSDDELLAILDSDPLSVIMGAEDSRPEVLILLALLQEPEEAVGAPTLRRWLRAGSPSPLKRLQARDFAGFEDALAELAERGLILRGGGEPIARGRAASRPARRR